MVITILFLALLKYGWHISWILWKELLYPSYGYQDHALFMGIGRALLNGLTPYVDIFENKPPGIFLVAAFSLWLNNDITFARIAQAIVLAAIPVVVGIAGFLRLQGSSIRLRIIGSACAFMFGSMLMFFTESYAGAFYTESFGAAFGVAYAALTIKRKWHYIDISVAALLLLATLGFKEQFLFSLFAVSLISSHTFREWLERFGIPLFIAMFLGTIALAWMGFLKAYVGTYLHYLLFDHRLILIQMGVQSPSPFHVFSWLGWIRSLHVVPFLQVTILLLMVMLFLPDRKDVNRPAWQRWLRIAATILFTLLSTQMAGNKGHQQVVGVPIYAAMFFASITICATWWRSNRFVRITSATCMVSMIASVFFFSAPSSHEWLTTERSKEVQIKQLAGTIDNILDQCNIERYLRFSVSKEQEYAYMRHSPLPMGLMQNDIISKLSVPLFRKQMRESLEVAKFALIRDGDILTPEVGQYLENNFTHKLPDCAGEPDLPDHLTLLFRKTNMASLSGT